MASSKTVYGVKCPYCGKTIRLRVIEVFTLEAQELTETCQPP